MSTEKEIYSELREGTETFIRWLNLWYAGNPVLSLFDFELVKFVPEEKSFSFLHKMKEECINALGAMHGGMISTLLDICLAAAAAAYTPGEKNVTQDIHLQFLKPIYFMEDILIKVKVLHVGARSISMTAQIIADGEECVTAMSTYARTGMKY